MTQPDLDALDQLGYVFEGEQRTLVWAAVAELRVAREVVETARNRDRLYEDGIDVWDELEAKVAAYDQVVGGGV